TQRHEARRIDNQLRGRAGRQGDPGSSRFFVSFEDELLRVFAPESTRNWLKRVGMEEDMALESRMVSRMIQKAQQRVEEYNFDMRKNVLEYDEVMDEQRKTIYSWRQKVLERRKVEEELVALAEEATQDAMDVYVDPKRSASEWDMEGLAEWFKHKHGEPLDVTSDTQGRAQELEDQLVGRVRDMFQSRCEAAGRELMVEFGREALLRTIDVRWKDHLRAMDVLRSGISLRAWAQHDPKIEYKSEAGRMFEAMMASIAEHVSDLLFRVHVEERDRSELGGVWQIAEARHDAFDIAAQADHQREAAHAAGEHKRIEPIRVEQKVGRNEPCPCGSGKKYKQCCGRTG
ncbi:MAG: SEC-C metal-binding domain-containing protein, partial [Candidatus Brocadiia bacterium]|nr:SEC-C metal-binding domain-containing protein [Candidatus Brocadiia bacterium]